MRLVGEQQVKGMSEGQWLITIVLLAAAAIGLIIATSDDVNMGPTRQYIGDAKLVTDPVNGCQYLVHNGITPRMRPDGKQICLGRQENGR